MSKTSVAEETGDQTLIKDVGGTIVGPKEWGKITRLTRKHLATLLQNSAYHCRELVIGQYPSGRPVTIHISHVNTVQFNNESRIGPSNLR